MATQINPNQIPASDPANVASYFSGSVTSTADVIDVSKLAAPVTVTVIPGATTTATVEFSTSFGAAAAPASANWQNWPDGTVSAATTDVFLGRLMAIRVTRASGSNAVVYEITA